MEKIRLQVKLSLKELKDMYCAYTPIYTDGSKDCVRVGAALAVSGGTIQSRLPDKTSIFSAEMCALYLALDRIREQNISKCIVFSDSLSCLQAIQNRKLENPLVLEFLERFDTLKRSGKDIILCWLPSHVGIRGNERAGAAAKVSLNLPITPFQTSFTDFRLYINKYLKRSGNSSGILPPRISCIQLNLCWVSALPLSVQYGRRRSFFLVCDWAIHI